MLDPTKRKIEEGVNMAGSPDIEEAFRRLFGVPDWNAFEKTAIDYFDANPKDHDAHSKFFENFTPQWQQLCSVRMYADAETLWKKAIEIVNKWERKSGSNIHKGTAYYFWGGTAILRGDIDLGFVLIHEALYEDINAESSGGKPADTLPAWYFVILKDEEQNHFWKPLIQEVAIFLDARLADYNRDCSGSLDLSHLKTQFMQNEKHREATFFFVYSIWKFKNDLNTISILANSSFSNLLLLDLSLNLYVVLEDILKSYYGNKKMLFQLIEEFSIAHDLDIHKCPPQQKQKRSELVNEQFGKNPDVTISNALSYKIPEYTPAQIALSIAPLLRNAAAHKLTSYPALQGQASKLLQLALNAIFTVIELRS